MKGARNYLYKTEGDRRRNLLERACRPSLEPPTKVPNFYLAESTKYSKLLESRMWNNWKLFRIHSKLFRIYSHQLLRPAHVFWVFYLNRLIQAALGERKLQGLKTYEVAQRAYETWSAQCEKQSLFPFQAVTRNKQPKQHISTVLLHQEIVQDIRPGWDRMRIMRSSMKLLEAKTWANCSPSTRYATYKLHHYFKVWLQY